MGKCLPSLNAHIHTDVDVHTQSCLLIKQVESASCSSPAEPVGGMTGKQWKNEKEKKKEGGEGLIRCQGGAMESKDGNDASFHQVHLPLGKWDTDPAVREQDFSPSSTVK